MDQLSVAADRSALSAILDAQGRHREAIVPLLEALELIESELGRDHYDVALLLVSLAGIATRAGEHARAEASYRRALGIQRRILGAGHPSVRETQANLTALRRAR